MTVAEMGMRLRKVQGAARNAEDTKKLPAALTVQQFNAMRLEMLKDLLCLLVHRDMAYHSSALGKLTDAYNAALNPVEHSML